MFYRRDTTNASGIFGVCNVFIIMCVLLVLTKKQKQHSQHTSSLTNENTTNKNKNFDKKYVLKAHESKQDLRRLVKPH